MKRCYIGLGSNLAEPRQQLMRAETALANLPHSRLIAVSAYYQSQAIGPGEQPDYLNAVAALDTTLTPLALLDQLQAIEQAQGRVRTVRWGARTLDLDLLLYGNQVLDLPRLQVPHPRLGERAFVLRPLADLAPDLLLPAGQTLQQLLQTCPDIDLIRPAP